MLYYFIYTEVCMNADNYWSVLLEHIDAWYNIHLLVTVLLEYIHCCHTHIKSLNVTGFWNRDGKRPSEKADLAIYIHVLGVSG